MGEVRGLEALLLAGFGSSRSRIWPLLEAWNGEYIENCGSGRLIAPYFTWFCGSWEVPGGSIQRNLRRGEALGGSSIRILRVSEAPGRLREAPLNVIYGVARPWEAHLYVFYVSRRLLGGLGGSER